MTEGTWAIHVRLLAVLVLLLSACSAAPPAPTSRAPAEARAPAPAAQSDAFLGKSSHKSFLWEVDSKTAKVYLLGSVHVANEDLYPLAPVIENAYESSDTLVLEVYLTKDVEAEVAVKSAKLGIYPDGDSVDKHLSPEAWARYSEFLQAEGKPILAFARMKPWLASLALMVDALGKSGFAPDQGIDRHFQERAEKDKKPIKSLETVDDQLDTLANVDDATGELMLLEFLDDRGDIKTQMDEAFVAWKQGDAKAMESIMLQSMMTPEYRPVFDKLFVERNHRMKAKLSEYLAGNGAYFVVVGSGHLVGEQGIVALLRRDQHQVEQL